MYIVAMSVYDNRKATMRLGANDLHTAWGSAKHTTSSRVANNLSFNVSIYLPFGHPAREPSKWPLVDSKLRWLRQRMK